MYLQRKILIYYTLILIAMFLVSCSSEEYGLKYNEVKEKVPSPPTTLEGIIDYPIGVLAEKDYRDDIEVMLDTVKEYLPRIEEMDEESLEDWWRVYYALFAEKYPDPRNIYSEIEIEPFDHPYLHLDLERFKKQINVLVILDVSSSMAQQINGESMIDIAKKSIVNFTSGLPEESNVGLIVYGHKGDSSDQKKRLSCKGVELVYDIKPYNNEQFEQTISPFKPTGWTPLAESLEEAKEELEQFPGDNNTNLIYVVSDGIETCDGDPVEIAKSFTDSNIKPIINVIGFNVEDKGQEQLREIAEIGNGTYTSAGNEKELKEVFEQAEDMLVKWEEWKEKTSQSVSEQRAKQIEKAEVFIEEWRKINDRERANVFSVINELRSNGYITEEAHSYFGLKRADRTYMYNDIGMNAYNEIIDKTEQDYEELMQQIKSQPEVESLTSKE